LHQPEIVCESSYMPIQLFKPGNIGGREKQCKLDQLMILAMEQMQDANIPNIIFA